MSNPAKKKKVLFVKHAAIRSKFATNDIDLLSEIYDVTAKDINARNNISIIFTLSLQFFYLLFTIYKYSLVYIWFADYHSFLPVLFAKIFGKKSIICAGGYEATYVPEVNCGVFTDESIAKRIRRFAVIFSLKNCSYILPVDETLIEHVNNYVNSDKPGSQPLRDGIKTFIPDIKTPFETVPPGYDGNLFKNNDSIRKENSVISAGLIINEYEFKRKGFDLLVECAPRMKDTKFVLIGLNDEYMDKIQSLRIENIEPYGIVSYEKLIEQYSKAKVYAQLSLFEGLPSAICEAMCCECVPVGSNVNGIPKIIDGTGYLVYNRNLDEIMSVLEKGLEAPKEMGFEARNQILKRFPLSKRRDSVLAITNKLIGT